MVDKTNKLDLDKLKTRLETEKQSLEKQLQGFAERDPKAPGDWDTKYPNFPGGTAEDEADEVEEYGSLLPVEATLETRLKEIVLALERIARDKFGQCEKCDREIEADRLEAIPETRVCHQCKL